jgi:predicted MFS family arabinose efflux permease
VPAGAFALLLGSVLAFGLSHSAYFLLPKYLATELGADATAIGAVSASSWFVVVALAPGVGVLVDRYGRKRLAVVGTAVLALVCAGFLRVGEIGPWLYALRLLHGAAFALFYVATSTLVADLAPPARMGQALGWFGAMLVSTNALAPALGEWIVERASWTAMFWLTALCALAALALVARVPEARGRNRSDEAPGLLATARRPGLPRVLAASACTGVAFAALFTFYQPWALALGYQQVSGFLIAYSIAAVGVRTGLGDLADRTGRRRVAAGSTVLYALACFATIELGAIGLWPLGVALGLAHGLLYPTLNAIAVEGVGDDARGKVMALYNAAFNVGFSCGSLALGLVAEAAGYPVAFAAGGLVCLLALPLLRSTPPRGV